MTETKTLIFKSYWGEAINTLWHHIDNGWSVVSASYLNSKRQFTIKLTTKSWLDIVIPCSRCGTEHFPKDLLFKPSPSKLCFCEVCSAGGNLFKASQGE